mmetsp:Transcript_35983/g.59609  ORF Transcript_35983/g.59609 Transcript_35983/m.59609 type:complete len:284 (-) Transcript_35983:218-1069(-)
MAHHFESSWFDPAKDVGAAAEHSPYRWNGLSWQYRGADYVNERVVGVQATAWHFVATVRNTSVPAPMRAVLWWGTDDHSYSPKIPVHGGAAAVHVSYDDANCTGRAVCREAVSLPGSVTEFTWDSAWWLSNLVADQVYTRKDRAAPVVLRRMALIDAELNAELEKTDAAALAAFAAGQSGLALEVLTTHAVTVGAKASKAWSDLWQQLVVSFIDGRITKLDPADHVSGATKEAASFTDSWKAKVIADTGDKYLVPVSTLSSAHVTKPSSHRAISKLTIKGVVG